jgi:hypothetical protein
MRSFVNNTIAASLLTALLCLADAGSAASAECKYSEKARDAVVRPALEAFWKEEARYYENSKPTVTKYPDGILELQFRRQPFKIARLPDGTIINDGIASVFFDPCKMRAWVPRGAIE